MGFKVVIKGNNDEIVLEKDRVLDIRYISDTPNDSNARATDLNVSLEISGKVTNEKDDMTKKLCSWSLVPSESQDAYKDLTFEVVSAGTVIRKVNLPNIFIVDYEESFNVKNGTGVFRILLRQKKEKISSIAVEGGYSAN